MFPPIPPQPAMTLLKDPQALMSFFFWMILLFAIAFPILFAIQNWREIKQTWKANCLLWKHPENTKENISTLELVNIPDPPGQNWPYKVFFFMPERYLKWCWEIKEGEGEDVSFKIEPFYPDDHIKFKGKTSASLANAVDWDWCKPILGRTSQFMEKLQQTGIIIMGCAALFGIFALLDELEKGG